MGFHELSSTLYSSSFLEIVEIAVHMDCQGCEKKIRRAISKLQGVDTLDVDLDKQKVTVTGYMDRRKVLKTVRRTGRKAEFWPSPFDGEYHPYALQHLEDSTYSSTHNYLRHGYNSSVQGYYPEPAYCQIIDDEMAALFNDDNVHACRVM
ncbi:unnamed protein product [Spirodela intermedia]|uniref:HMA domain-containing protein n=1 Tax=Spirodela intermedia TaxID=51605 RepID=A0A7I8K4V1_SPIIN|nr:unnamed protein product [Spirodela intermedia]